MKIVNFSRYLKSLSQLGFLDFLRLVMRLPYYWFSILKGTRFIEVRVNGRYKMLIDLADKGISKELMLLGAREREHYQILKSELKEGMAVFDLGANIGYYAIMMGLLVGKTGKIYAAEPSRSNFNLLAMNIRLNCLENVIDAYNIGISTKTGFEKFYESAKSNWHTFYPKVHGDQRHESLEHKTPVDVPVSTISDFIKGKRPIELIRMDVEGYEVEILHSMCVPLEDKNFKPLILFEVHQPRYDAKEHNMAVCLKKIFARGYRVKVLASNDHDGGAGSAFRRLGYQPRNVIRTDYMRRGMYYQMKNEDAIYFICDTNYVRTVLLERL